MKKFLIISLVIFGFSVVSLNVHGVKFEKSRQSSSTAFDEIDKKLSLYFYDAVTGKPIQGASFEMNGEKGVTDIKGKVSIPFPQVDEHEKMMYGMFSKKGYILSKIEVRFLVGTVFLHRYSISPKLDPGKMRIVLDWSEKPADLDAHLIKKDNGVEKYHISYRDMKSYEDKVILDRDDRDGFGPETITILEVDTNGTYSYLVHDYTHRNNKGSDGLQKSRARVMLFGDDKLIDTFYVPQKTGNLWEVFSYKNGQLKKH
jgi:hypothetical protein